MPIRINLLAEAQALEDMRRRDPVKRAVWIGVLLVLGLLVWSSSLQLKSMIAKGELSRLEGSIAAKNAEYKAVLQNQQKLADARQRLTKLHQLACNRLLYGNVLNALQQAAIDDVQLVRFRMEQNYSLADEVKPKTNDNKTITPGKPATATEKLVMYLDARDSGGGLGDQVNKYKQALAEAPYLQILGKSNEVKLASLSPPQVGPDGKSFVLFSLECRFPETTR